MRKSARRWQLFVVFLMFGLSTTNFVTSWVGTFDYYGSVSYAGNYIPTIIVCSPRSATEFALLTL